MTGSRKKLIGATKLGACCQKICTVRQGSTNLEPPPAAFADLRPAIQLTSHVGPSGLHRSGPVFARTRSPTEPRGAGVPGFHRFPIRIYNLS